MDTALQQILTAREARASRQQALLHRYGKPLVCFTMNIAGPEKRSDLIRRGFQQGDRLLKAQLSDLPIIHREQEDSPAGFGVIYVVDAPAPELKRRAVEVEECSPAARLYDIDVLAETGHKLDRQTLCIPQRTCLICGGPAYVCARSRAHSVDQLREKTTALLRQSLEQEDARRIARLAEQSLLFEVGITPKPGLVDCRNCGSHTDMDLFTFLSSAAALHPYFAQCAQIGQQTRRLSPPEVFARLRFPGKVAEGTMRRVTMGVNTHKGAIFSLGILCAAAGRLEPDHRTPARVLELCRDMTRGLTKEELESPPFRTAETVGRQLYAQHGIAGVRGQAEAGFPQVLEVGLPTLEKGLADGYSLNEAGCAALLALMTVTADTNLIHRSSVRRQQQLCQQLRTLLKQHPYPSRALLEELDDAFIRENLSPGGCADLLSVTLFLHALQADGDLIEP